MFHDLWTQPNDPTSRPIIDPPIVYCSKWKVWSPLLVYLVNLLACPTVVDRPNGCRQAQNLLAEMTKRSKIIRQHLRTTGNLIRDCQHFLSTSNFNRKENSGPVNKGGEAKQSKIALLAILNESLNRKEFCTFVKFANLHKVIEDPAPLRCDQQKAIQTDPDSFL